MSSTAKWVVAVIVTGALVATSGILFVVQWDSTKNGAATFGKLAVLSAIIFTAVGWTRKRSLRKAGGSQGRDSEKSG